MKGNYKMKIINYSVSLGNPVCSSKNKEKQREIGSESHLSASNGNGGKGEFSIYSSELRLNSCLDIIKFAAKFTKISSL